MKNSKNKIIYLSIVLVLAVIIVIIALPKSLPVNKDTWQAVFLTNDQVYFGKLSSFNNKYMELADVYYLQSDQSISKEQSGGDINLIKLGSEIHGPEDVMYISKSQILFWENLGANSRVMKIISNYKK